MEIRLIEVNKRYLDDIWEYRKELIDINDSFDGTSNLKSSLSKEDFFNSCILKENNQRGLVPNTLYLSIDDNDRVIGMIDFRHHINHPILSSIGGHIGYNIRPCERRKGYGTKQLALCLKKVKQFGLNKILITCKKENEASRKIILNNGGIYQKDVKNGDTVIERYWITINDK